MTTIKLRRGTAAEWTAANPILAAGEAGFEIDTGRHKIGNGGSHWAALDYYWPEDDISNLVDQKVEAHKAESDPHPQYMTSSEGDQKIADHKAESDPHPQYMTSQEVTSALNPYATLNSAALTGSPTAPTKPANDSSDNIATTSYADRAVATGSGLLIPKSLFDANTIIKANDDNTPVALTVAPSSLVGRGPAGGIAALGPADVRFGFDLAQASMVGNLLTPNQASAGDALGTTAGFVAIASTLTVVSSGAYQGNAFIRATVFGGGGSVCVGGNHLSGSIPVTPGQPFTALMMVKSDQTASGYVRMYWWTSAGNVAASTAYSDSPSVALSATWSRYVVTAVAPGNAAYVSMRSPSSSVVGATIDVDMLGWWAGAGGDWAMPGVPITNLGHRVTHPNVDDVLVQKWDAGLGRWQTVHYDSGLRALVVTSGGSVTSGAFASTDWGPNASNAGYIHIRRINSVVYCWIQWAEAKVANPTGSLVTHADGFRSGAATSQFVIHVQNTQPNVFFTSAGNSSINRGAGTCNLGDCIGRGGAMAAQWFTADAIPTSLPGTRVDYAPA